MKYGTISIRFPKVVFQHLAVSILWNIFRPNTDLQPIAYPQWIISF